MKYLQINRGKENAGNEFRRTVPISKDEQGETTKEQQFVFTKDGVTEIPDELFAEFARDIKKGALRELSPKQISRYTEKTEKKPDKAQSENASNASNVANEAEPLEAPENNDDPPFNPDRIKELGINHQSIKKLDRVGLGSEEKLRKFLFEENRQLSEYEFSEEISEKIIQLVA